MSFTATPVDGSTPPLPMSSVVPDGTNTPLAVEGGPSISTGGNTIAPVSMYVKDGNDLAEGATTDAAVTGDVSGSVSAKLRGLSKILNSVWDNVNNRLNVAVVSPPGISYFGSSVANGVLTNACTASNAANGTTVANNITTATGVNNYAEVFSQGGSSATATAIATDRKSVV